MNLEQEKIKESKMSDQFSEEIDDENTSFWSQLTFWDKVGFLFIGFTAIFLVVILI